MVDPLSYVSFQPVLHDWCNIGRGMCYPLYGMVHIKELLPLIGNSSLCGGSGFPLSLSEWSFTIYPTPYNRKYNVLSASLNKTFPSYLTADVLSEFTKMFICLTNAASNISYENLKKEEEEETRYQKNNNTKNQPNKHKTPQKTSTTYKTKQ